MKKLSSAFVLAAGVLWGCASAPTTFKPRSQYPPDPWVKGYANPDDCLGGELLAARSTGNVENVSTERSVPEGVFEKHTERVLKDWAFAPPKSEGLQNCRILIRYRVGIVSIA